MTSDGLYKSDEEAQKGPDQTEILIAPSQYPTVAGSLKYKDLNNDGKITRGKYTLDDHGDLTVIGNDQIGRAHVNSSHYQQSRMPSSA